LVDSDIPAGVVEIVKKETHPLESMGTSAATETIGDSGDPPQTEHRAVVNTALMVLCNLLNSYAPFREVGPRVSV